MGYDHVRRERRQLCCVPTNFIGFGRGPARVDLRVAADTPAGLLETLQECAEAGLKFPIVRSRRQENANEAHLLALLRAHRERPRCRAAEQSDEAPPSQIEHAASSPGATAIIDRPAACLHRFCAPRQWACTARTDARCARSSGTRSSNLSMGSACNTRIWSAIAFSGRGRAWRPTGSGYWCPASWARAADGCLTRATTSRLKLFPPPSRLPIFTRCCGRAARYMARSLG